MASKFAGALLVLVLAASMLASATANKGWGWPAWNSSTTAGNWNHTNNNNNFWGFWHKNSTTATQQSKRINVGGSENWHFGFNYTDWAIKNGPFYLNDTLVFKYDPPSNTTFPHSVYLVPNFWSFQNCDLRWARKVGEVNQGGGEGFEFVLKRWQPHYFVCGEHNGIHCRDGMMKFSVWPLIRWNY